VASKVKVALVYVPAGTVLNPSRERSPISRPKSTAVGVESTCTEVELLLSVMLLMVMLNATTEGKGASSPVTNTVELPDPDVVDEVPPPHPINVSAVSARTTAITDLFIEKLLFTRLFRGSQLNYEYAIENPVSVGKLHYSRTGYGGNSRAGRGFWSGWKTI
jgi:hypothetical protein